MSEPHDILRTRWSSDDPRDRFIVHDPATGRPIATVQGSSEAQVDAAVRAAHAAHYDWKARTPRERGVVLRRVADVVRQHIDELAALESSDNGKPVTQARLDCVGAVAVLELFASLTEAIPGAVRDAGALLDITMLEPYGVIGAIVPFNWPPVHTAGKIAPALAVGNAVVLKPPEQAPLSVLRMVELITPLLPTDLLHVIPGGGAVGAMLAAHPLVGKVSFTGAPSTGAAVIKTAADNLTPTLMELGGKNPFIVFPDADLDSALRWALEGGFFNQGEACTAASRVLVHTSLYEQFAERFAAAVKRLRVGHGASADTHVGPVVTAAHQARVLEYIDIGVREGAHVAAQAPLPADPELAGGSFVPPTLFTHVHRNMRIAREEIFGPVVVMIPFSDEAEAISIANDTSFGLVAAVFTRDAERQLRVSRAISAGIVFINNYSRTFMGTPFGGTKHSGFGREHAIETLRELAYTKSVRLPSGSGSLARWSPSNDVFD